MKTERFNLLGEFEYISRFGQAGEIDLAKNIGLLAILLLSKDFASTRARLIDLLWSDRCDEQGRASLRHSLWSLKKVFAGSSPGLLQADRKKVRLDPGLCSTDITEFFELSLMGGRLSLEQAGSLYRGELLEGLLIRDRQWNEWLRIERDVLQSRYSANLCELCQHYQAAGEAAALLATGRQLVEHDQLSEDGQRAMMAGYLMLNQRTQALKQFRNFARLMRSELNSLPGPAISALYEKIKAGAGSAELAGKLAPVLSGAPGVALYESSDRVAQQGYGDPGLQAAAAATAVQGVQLGGQYYGVHTAYQVDESLRQYRIDID